jgi:phosphatidylglycerol:prolipoprotein diacylglycerol transferase
LPFPDFDPVLVHLGPFAIRWYALAYVAGILIGWRYAVGLVRNASLWRGAAPTAVDRQVDDFVLWVTIGIIVGGRLGYVLFYMLLQQPDLLLQKPWTIFATWEGGMSFHGGLIGVTLAILGFARNQKIDVVRLGDLTAACAPFGLFFGRLANFINGELWGRPTGAPWGIVFCNTRLQMANGGVCPAGFEPRHPSQLYEAGLEGLVLFAILRFATHGRKLLPRRGAVSGLFLLFYGLFRMALENVREPDRGMPDFPFGLTMGMLLSLPLVLGGIALLVWSRRPSALAQPLPPSPEVDGLDPAVTAPGATPPEVSADTFDAAFAGMDERAADSFAPDAPSADVAATNVPPRPA